MDTILQHIEVPPPERRRRKYRRCTEAEVRRYLGGRLARFGRLLVHVGAWRLDGEEFCLLVFERRMIRDLGYEEPAEQLLARARLEPAFLVYEEVERIRLEEDVEEIVGGDRQLG